MLKYSFLIVAIGLIHVSVSFSQKNFANDIKKVNLFYHNTINFSCDISFAVYKDYKDKVPVNTERGALRKKNESIYYKIGEIETVSNSTHVIVADFTSKFVSIFPASNKTNNDITGIMSGIENEIKNYKVLSYVENGNTNYYEFTGADKRIEKIKVEFDRKKYFITEISYKYKTPVDISYEDDAERMMVSVVSIKYFNFSFSPDANEDYFTYNRYFEKDLKNLVLKNKFKEYQYVNYLEEN
jgi:hypothetical protein